MNMIQYTASDSLVNILLNLDNLIVNILLFQNFLLEIIQILRKVSWKWKKHRRIISELVHIDS